MDPIKARLRPWLVAQIDSGKIPGLHWLNKEKSCFQIPWKHGAKHDWTENDSVLFMEWAKHKGRFRPGIDEPNYKSWKTRLRCAFNKATDIREKKELSQPNGANPFKVFELLPREAGAGENKEAMTKYESETEQTPSSDVSVTVEHPSKKSEVKETSQTGPTAGQETGGLPPATTKPEAQPQLQAMALPAHLLGRLEIDLGREIAQQVIQPATNQSTAQPQAPAQAQPQPQPQSRSQSQPQPQAQVQPRSRKTVAVKRNKRDEPRPSLAESEPEPVEHQTFVLKLEDVANDVLQGIHKLWYEDRLCDVVIQANNGLCKAHRLVLASQSPYLTSVFEKQPIGDTEWVCLHIDVDTDAMNEVLLGAYTGQLCVNRLNFYSVRKAAQKFGLIKISELCDKFLKEQLQKEQDKNKTGNVKSNDKYKSIREILARNIRKRQPGEHGSNKRLKLSSWSDLAIGDDVITDTPSVNATARPSISELKMELANINHGTGASVREVTSVRPILSEDEQETARLLTLLGTAVSIKQEPVDTRYDINSDSVEAGHDQGLNEGDINMNTELDQELRKSLSSSDEVDRSSGVASNVSVDRDLALQSSHGLVMHNFGSDREIDSPSVSSVYTDSGIGHQQGAVRRVSDVSGGRASLELERKAVDDPRLVIPTPEENTSQDPCVETVLDLSLSGQTSQNSKAKPQEDVTYQTYVSGNESENDPMDLTTDTALDLSKKERELPEVSGRRESASQDSGQRPVAQTSEGKRSQNGTVPAVWHKTQEITSRQEAESSLLTRDTDGTNSNASSVGANSQLVSKIVLMGNEGVPSATLSIDQTVQNSSLVMPTGAQCSNSTPIILCAAVKDPQTNQLKMVPLLQPLQTVPQNVTQTAASKPKQAHYNHKQKQQPQNVRPSQTKQNKNPLGVNKRPTQNEGSEGDLEIDIVEIPQGRDGMALHQINSNFGSASSKTNFEKPYCCVICWDSFYGATECCVHIEEKHQKTRDAYANMVYVVSYRCDLCGSAANLTTAGLPLLLEHMSAKHDQRLNHAVCTECKHVFMSCPAAEAHLKNTHNIQKSCALKYLSLFFREKSSTLTTVEVFEANGLVTIL